MPNFTSQPPRSHRSGRTYFLTFNVFQKNPILHNQGIPEFLVKELEFYSKKIKKLIAYTIQRNHIHLLIDVDHFSTISDFLRDFKKYTSHFIKKTFDEPPRFVWQRGTWDHCIGITDYNDLKAHLDYTFYNSFKHLGITPKDFPYHNFLDFVEKGIYSPDFCFPTKAFTYETA